MSWSEARRRGSAAPIGAAAIVLAMALPLGGCFQPVYLAAGGTVAADLRGIQVDPVPERFGHYVRDELLTDINGSGAPVTPKYRLTLSPRERLQTALVDITTQRTQAGTIVTDVDYKLYPIGSDTPIAAGTVSSAASYNRNEQRFANIRAARDAEIRDARTVADQLAIRLAAAIAAPQPLPKPPAPPSDAQDADTR